MGPKKKGGKKKVGKKSGGTKGPAIIDGVPVSEMSKDQLEGHVRRLQEELAREREERNYYQVERDRLTTFWEVGKKQLEECRSEARVKDRELEEAEERHQTEIKVFKQKVKHLLYEQEHNLAELKAENMVSLKVAREESQKVEQLHLEDKRQLKGQLDAKDKQYRDLLRSMQMQHSEESEKMRQAFEDRVREIERRYSDRFVGLRSELQLRLKSEISETEERKNGQIESLKKRHEKAVVDMKNYYNDITLNNLAMISTLKEEIRAKEEKLERNEQLLGGVQQENRKLAEPLKKAKEQLADLQRQLGTQEKDKSGLIAARAKLKVSQKEVEELKWELEVLEQKYDRVVVERDDLHEKFSSSVLEMQQKSALKYLVLEKKISAMKSELDVKEAQLHSVLSSTSDSNDNIGDKVKKTRNIVEEQGSRIRKLERDILMMRQRRQWGDQSQSSSTTPTNRHAFNGERESNSIDNDMMSEATGDELGSISSTGSSITGSSSSTATSSSSSTITRSRTRSKSNRGRYVKSGKKA